MKKKLYIGIYCLCPLLLSVILLILSEYMRIENDIVMGVFLFVCYAIPVFGLIYFVKKRPFNQWLLFVGFTLPPLLTFLYSYFRPVNYSPEYLQYLMASLILIFYSAPFMVISLIIALVITIRDRRRG